MQGLILEPAKYYEKYAREKHKSNLNEHFDSLVAQSGVDVNLNRETVKRYKKELSVIEKLKARMLKYKVGLALLIILAILGGIAVGVGIYIAVTSDVGAGVITAVSGALALLVGILVSVKVMRPKIKTLQDKIDAHVKHANEILREAEAEMAPLNALFDDVDTFRLIEKTMPEVSFDRRYSPEQRQLLTEDYDYEPIQSDNISVTDTLSGKLFGNPFLFERHNVMTVGTHTYTGTLTIRWTETYRDSKGNVSRRTRTQVLTASLVKPKPYYKTETHLGFGSLAAPDLTFTREGNHVEDLSERRRERKVKRGEKKLQRKAQKAISKGGTFQEMVNTEFDVLFGATDRNHEVQFRLMYTPLAQQNTLDLITTETGYGDDFDFFKKKKYNVIKSDHAQSWQMKVTAAHYRSYDIDDARARFVGFNENYFKSVFFDFAPLMAVPAYQDEPVHSMKTPDAVKSNYTAYEHEVLANAIGASVFKHPKSATDAILKTAPIRSAGNVDRVAVTAYSFRAEPRLDFVPVLGGDGRMHAVPVNWIEYIPIVNQSDMAVCALDHSERTFYQQTGGAVPYNASYLHGLLAYPIAHNASDGEISNTFNKYI